MRSSKVITVIIILVYSLVSISCSYINEIDNINDVPDKKLVKLKITKLRTKSGREIKFNNPYFGLVYDGNIIGEGTDDKGVSQLFKIPITDINSISIHKRFPLKTIIIVSGVSIAILAGLTILTWNDGGYGPIF